MRIGFSYNDRYTLIESSIEDIFSVRSLFDIVEKECKAKQHSLDVYAINVNDRNSFLGTGYISKKGDFLGFNISSYGFGVIKDLLFDEDLPF